MRRAQYAALSRARGRWFKSLPRIVRICCRFPSEDRLPGNVAQLALRSRYQEHSQFSFIARTTKTAHRQIQGRRPLADKAL